MEQQPFGFLCGTKERSTVATRTYFSDTLSEDATFEMVNVIVIKTRKTSNYIH